MKKSQLWFILSISLLLIFSCNQETNWASGQINSEAAAEVTGQFFISSSANTPIRRGAQTAYNQTGLVQKGQIVKALSQFTNGNGEQWIQVNNGNVTGWVPLANLRAFTGMENVLNRQLLAKGDVQVQRESSTNAKPVFTLKKGQQMMAQSFIILNHAAWYRIKTGDKSGWIPASSAANQLSLSIYLYGKNQTAAVRNGASSSYRTVSTLTVGQKVQTTTEFINDKNEMWYRIALGNGKYGWVLASSLTTKPLKIAYLTIDDGPSVYTTTLLNTLNTYHAKATFFMINGNMNAHQSEVKRMVKDGHALGSHSVTHDKNLFYRSASSAVNEMITTRNTIKKITGLTSNLMRVPYGSVPYMKQSYRDATNKQHFIMWDWTVDSLDWKFNSSSYVSYTLNQVKKQEQSGTTPVILIHDRKATVSNLPALLSALEKLGYTLAPISESVKPYQFHSSN